MDPMILECFVRASEACYDSEAFNAWVARLTARRLRMIAQDEEMWFADVGPGVSEALQQHIERYFAHQQASLTLRLYLLDEMTFYCDVVLIPAQGLLACSVDMEAQYRSIFQPATYQLWLEIITDMYASWLPFYGYLAYTGGMRTDRAELLAHQQIHYLYAINLFGPELVERLGRERLLAAPAWRKDDLPDGGILLLPIDQTLGEEGYSWRQVAEALGLQTPQAPGAVWEEDGDV